MCPKQEHPDWVSHGASGTERQLPSESGSTPSPGPTGERSLLANVSESTVRRHRGLSTISVSTWLVTEDLPASFTVLKRGDLGGYMVMLSCVMTSSEYSTLIAMLETRPSMVGKTVTVGVEFEPTTPNLVQPTTAPST